MSSSEFLGAPAVSVALIAGFLLLHIYERFFGSHEPAERITAMTTNMRQTLQVASVRLPWADMFFSMV